MDKEWLELTPEVAVRLPKGTILRLKIEKDEETNYSLVAEVELDNVCPDSCSVSIKKIVVNTVPPGLLGIEGQYPAKYSQLSYDSSMVIGSRILWH
ncbi:MAG: hypothetical protein ABSC49_00040 [Candidatus Microgenomates bacterium]|jgi:hypothetical protein